MRGGALPVIAWFVLLGTLMATNAIWTHDTIQIETYAFAVGVTIATALLLTVTSRRRALQRGAPELERGHLEAVPDISFGAALAGLGLGVLVFGFVFGHFLVYFGLGLVVIASARVAQELRAQSQTLREHAAHARFGEGVAPGERPR